MAPVARTEELKGHELVVRILTMRSVSDTGTNLTLWRHTRTILKVVGETYEIDPDTREKIRLKSTKTRFFVTSLAVSELTPEKWLQLVVMRWGVETVHQVLDCAFEEDKHPWITSDANGALAVMLLRRLVYTVLTLFKSVTLRSEENREMPWRELLDQVRDTLEWADGKAIDGLRPRTFAVPKAIA